MDRKKIHELLDLVLDIQDRGKGKNGFPYIEIDFSNFGDRISLYAMKNGFVVGDYDLNIKIESDYALYNAIDAVKGLLEIAVDKAEEQYA